MNALRLALILCCACSPQLIDAIDGPPEGSSGRGGANGASSSGSGGSGDDGGSGGTGNDSGTGGDAGEPGGGGTTAVLRGDALLHRYSFDGVGTSVTDDKGGAHGTVINTELMGTGTLVLAGLGSDQYVDLPDELISGLGDATFETWVTWYGGNYWQRIFDFGSNFPAPTDGRLTGDTYLFLSPYGDTDVMRATFTIAGPGEAEVFIDGTSPLPADEISHVAVVFDDQNDLFSLYRNGLLEGEVPIFEKLADISDVNNWIGKSQYGTDAEFGGIVHEFRIYDAALSAEEIAVSFQAGPQAVFPTP